MADQTVDQSKFNMGLAMLQRIDSIFNCIADCSIRNDLIGKSEALFALLSEIRFLMNKKELITADSFFNEVHSIRTFYNQTKNKNQIYECFYINLMEFETYLRSFINSKDMLLSKKADIHRSITEMHT
jgi:hypothetical protein